MSIFIPIMLKYQKHIIVFALSIFIGGFVAINAGQDQNFDLLNYHYVNPHSFLENRVEYNVALGELQSYANPLPDVPSYLLISHLSPRAAAGVLGMIQGLNIWVIFEIMLVLLKRVKAKQSAKILVATGVSVASFFGAASASEVGGTMGDNMTSIFVLLGLLLMLCSFQEPKPQINTRVIRVGAYMLVGIAAGLKLTNIVYGIGIGLAGLLIEGSVKKKIQESILHVSSFLIGVLLVAGYWYIKMWQLFRNPIFPFYNNVFKSEYYFPVNFVDKRWLPTSFGQTLLYPFNIVSEQTISSELPFKDPRLSVVFSLAVLLIIVGIIRKLLHKKVLPNWTTQYSVFWVFFLVSYILWIKQFSYYRYLLSLELVCLVAIAILLYNIIPKFTHATAVLVVVIVTIILQTQPINWGRTPWRSTFFGVTKADFTQQENSTVLLAGYAPLGFIVPYLPSSSQAIRIESDLSSPAIGTPTMQAYIKSLVKQRQQAGSNFYAIRADEEQAQTETAFNSYGFKTQNCKELPIYTRQDLPSKIRLCKLATNNLGA